MNLHVVISSLTVGWAYAQTNTGEWFQQGGQRCDAACAAIDPQSECDLDVMMAVNTPAKMTAMINECVNCDKATLLTLPMSNPESWAPDGCPGKDGTGLKYCFDPPTSAGWCGYGTGGFTRFCYCKPPPAAAGAAGVSGDPITTYRGKETKFFLPVGKFTIILRAPGLVVRARTFYGEKALEQWIDSIIVEDTSVGHRLVDVKIGSRIANFTRTHTTKDGKTPASFETLEVKAPWWSQNEEPLSFPSDESQLVRWGSHTFVGQPLVHPTGATIDFARIENSGLVHPGAPRREYVLITHASLSIVITSTSALEYYWEDADDQRALRFSHLDIEFLNIKQESSLTGVLPEIWGLVPGKNGSEFLSDSMAENATHEQDEEMPTSTDHGAGSQDSTASEDSMVKNAPHKHDEEMATSTDRGARSQDSTTSDVDGADSKTRARDLSRQILVDMLEPVSKASHESSAARVCGGSVCANISEHPSSVVQGVV